MLAYVFWHQPAAADGYEDGLRAFHEQLEVPSASFRLRRLPFLDEPGYEDWYLVESWDALGRLGRVAVANRAHDPVAAASRTGWGGVWAPVAGAAEPPSGGLEWIDKPRGVPYADFIAGLGGRSVWCRQLVLGPAPEIAVESDERDPGRVRVA